MNKNIKKIFLPAFLLLLPHFCFAKIICEEPKKIIPKLQWDIQKLNIDTSKTTREIEKISNAERMVDKISVVLGLFAPKYAVSITPNIIKTSFSNDVCIKLQSVDILFSIKPTIYISKEAMQFSCTKARVYEHELKHYNIEIEALNKLDSFLYEHGYKSLMKINYINNENFEKEIKVISKKVSEEIFEYLKMHTKFRHIEMDTDESYKKETQKCTEEENYKLYTLIKNGNQSLNKINY